VLAFQLQLRGSGMLQLPMHGDARRYYPLLES